jgi:acetyl esterase/lipase
VENLLAGSLIKNDPIDALTARPSFQILIYPGPLVVPDSVSVTAPTTFLLASNDDACCSQPVITLLQMHRRAKVPVEVHLYEQGGHGFNMGKRSVLSSLHTWPQRLADWLKDTGISNCCK